jgi:hypothetical protein
MNLFQRAFHLSHFIFPKGGTCVEFGVFKGATFAYQAEQVLTQYKNTKIVGFDSWKGLPEETPGVWAPERHNPGEYFAQKNEVLLKLSQIGANTKDPRFKLVDGFFEDTLTDALRKTIDRLIFVNVDVDIHRSTIELLDFLGPLLRPGVIIYWDDWKDPRDEGPNAWGEHLAWDEWHAKHDHIEVETIEVNPVNQRIMIVSRVRDTALSTDQPSMYDIRCRAMQLAESNGDSSKKSNCNFFARIKTKLLK